MIAALAHWRTHGSFESESQSSRIGDSDLNERPLLNFTLADLTDVSYDLTGLGKNIKIVYLDFNKFRYHKLKGVNYEWKFTS